MFVGLASRYDRESRCSTNSICGSKTQGRGTISRYSRSEKAALSSDTPTEAGGLCGGQAGPGMESNLEKKGRWEAWGRGRTQGVWATEGTADFPLKQGTVTKNDIKPQWHIKWPHETRWALHHHWEPARDSHPSPPPGSRESL